MVRSGVREIVSPCLPSRISSRLHSFSFTACGPRKLPVLVAHYNLLLPSHSLGTVWGCRGSPVLVSHHNYESFPSFRLSPALLICTKGCGDWESPEVVKFGRASRARPQGRRVFGRCPWASRTEVTRALSRWFQGAVSGAVEAVWDAR